MPHCDSGLTASVEGPSLPASLTALTWPFGKRVGRPGAPNTRVSPCTRPCTGTRPGRPLEAHRRPWAASSAAGTARSWEPQSPLPRSRVRASLGRLIRWRPGHKGRSDGARPGAHGASRVLLCTCQWPLLDAQQPRHGFENRTKAAESLDSQKSRPRTGVARCFARHVRTLNRDGNIRTESPRTVSALRLRSL